VDIESIYKKSKGLVRPLFQQSRIRKPIFYLLIHLFDKQLYQQCEGPIRALSFGLLDEKDCGKCASVCPSGAFKERNRGFVVFLGGKVGRFPQRGRKCPWILGSEQEVYALFDAVLNWYVLHGERGERLGQTADRVGWTDILACLRESVPLKSNDAGCQSRMC